MEVKDYLYIIGIFAALVGSVIGAMPAIRKTKAERDNAISDSAENLASAVNILIKPMEARLQALELERQTWLKEKIELIAALDATKKELNLWRNYAARLIKQIYEISPTTPPIPFDTDPKINIKGMT